MEEYIKIIKEFQSNPDAVLSDEKKHRKLEAALNKSIKLLHKEQSIRNSKNSHYFD